MNVLRISGAVCLGLLWGSAEVKAALTANALAGNSLSSNTLGSNGLSSNGLAFNGDAYNFLSVAGLPVNGLATSDPGTAFTIDFSAALPGLQPPYTADRFLLGFQSLDGNFSHLNLRLWADPTVYVLSPIDARQTQETFYDPAYFDLTLQPDPKLKLSQFLIDDLADGKISGTFWVDGADQSVNRFILVLGMSDVPEPATLTVMSLGGLIILRRRRR